MTSGIVLHNVKLILDAKGYSYSASLECIKTTLESSTGKTCKIAKDQAKTINFNDPEKPIACPKVGNEITVNWKMKMVKDASPNDPKLYDKTINIPIGGTNTSHTVLLGKVGSVSFSCDTPNDAELKKKQEEERRAREAEEQRRRAEEEERQRQLAAEAERQRLIEEQNRAKMAQDAEQRRNFIALLEQTYMRETAQFEVESTMLESHGQTIKSMWEEEKRAELEAAASRPPVWPSLNPELRIAKLFLEPVAVAEDPIYAEICAKPQLPPPAQPPEYNSNNSEKDNGKQSPPPQRRGGAGGGKDNSPPARRPTPLDILHANSNDADAIISRMTAPEKFGASAFEQDFGKLDPNAADSPQAADPDFEPQKFYRVTGEGVTNPLKRLGKGVEDLDPLDSLPKINRQQQQQDQQDGTAGALPRETPRRQVGFADQQQVGGTNSSKQQQQQQNGAAGYSRTPSESKVSSSSASAIAAAKSNKKNAAGEGDEEGQQKRGEEEEDPEEQPRFEIDLDPAPPLMAALLHLSRDGGNMNAMLPLDQQTPMLIDMQNSQMSGAHNQSGGGGASSTLVMVNGNNNNASMSSQTARLQSLQHSGARRAGSASKHVAVHNNPVVQQQQQQQQQQRASKAGSSPDRHNNNDNNNSPPRENSMSPRRKLPLVFTDYGEVVSRTTRDDSRSLPSFMRRDAHSHRLQTVDPAQSYWNCFAPQKAQGLVGVRMPSSAVEAFEEAAELQVEAATPPRRVTGVVPTQPRNVRTTKAPDSSLRKVTSHRVADVGESSSHRAERRW